MVWIILVLLLYVLPVILIIDAGRIYLSSNRVMVLEVVIGFAIALIPIGNVFLCSSCWHNILEDYSSEDLQKLSLFGFLFKTIGYEEKN